VDDFELKRGLFLEESPLRRVDIYAQINQFLTDSAVNGHVSTSTQK
jgi:hypothetical protein